MSNCFIILAAGKSNRFISKIPKPYIKYKGDILINHSINKAILSKKFSKIVKYTILISLIIITIILSTFMVEG